MNVLLIGVGYFPWLTSGEKNFFYRLLPHLVQKCGLAVFSLNDYAEERLTQETNGVNIPVYCAKRPFHHNYERFFFEGNGYTSYHHRHKPPQEIAEKFSSIVVHLPRLRRIIRRHQIDVIHFMDNFGPSMPFLRLMFPSKKVTYSAANYDLRGRQSVYDAYLKMSIGHLDGAGVYTDAYRRKLRDLGVRTPLGMTPWGVPLGKASLTDAQKSNIRQSLGVAEGQYLLLWSGYLQQIQEHDYYKTIKVARQVTAARDDITFLFAFKPETYKPAYAEEAAERILVKSGLKNFGNVLETADLFCSPISNTRSTVSPPLTWLEAMSKGTPVVTTDIGGVREILTHQQTGFIAKGYPDFAEVILDNVDAGRLAQVSAAAKALAEAHYGIENSAEQYIQFWKSILSGAKNGNLAI